MGRMLRNNGLSLVLLLLFLAFIVGQAVTGMHEYNDEQAEHGEPSLQMNDYLRTGHFVEITAENWESELVHRSPSPWTRLMARRVPVEWRTLRHRVAGFHDSQPSLTRSHSLTRSPSLDSQTSLDSQPPSARGHPSTPVEWGME